MVLKKNQPIRWRERVGTMIVGHAFKRLEKVVFDYTLYPAVIALLGTVVGGLAMCVFSAGECYLLILLYDWTKRDWLGLELLKEVRDGEERQGRLARFIQKVAKKGNVSAFFMLSCFRDPFETTVYLRHGVEAYNGLSFRDWKIFWASVFVGNLYWTVVITIAVRGVLLLFKRFGFA